MESAPSLLTVLTNRGGPSRPDWYSFFNCWTGVLVPTYRTMLNSRPRPNPRGKRRRGCRNCARILRRPAGIGGRVPAERSRIVDDVPQDHRSVQRLRINLITLKSPDEQSLQGKCAVKLGRARVMATPAGHHGGGYRTGCVVEGDDLRGENAGHSRGRNGQCEGIRGEHVPADCADVRGVVWVRVKIPQSGTIVVESGASGDCAVGLVPVIWPGSGAKGNIIAPHTPE